MRWSVPSFSLVAVTCERQRKSVATTLLIAALLMEPYVFDRTLEAQYAALDALERIAEVLMAASFTFDNAAESEANA